MGKFPKFVAGIIQVVVWSLLCSLAIPSRTPAAEPGEVLIRESSADSTAGAPVPIHLELAGGMIQHFWEPGLSDKLVGFDTEGLRAWWAELGLRIGGLPVVLLHADRPFKPTPRQEEMLRAAQHRESGYEQYAAFLDLLPVTSRLMDKKPGFAAVLRALASVRLIYSRNLFFGQTASDVDFAYFPQDVIIDRTQDPPVVDGHVEFKAGEPLEFKTEFQDFHVMIPVFHDRNPKNQEKVLRFGFFHSRWEKPMESVYASFEGDPILQDTRLDTQGISGSYEQGLFDPGLGLRVDSDWGILGSKLTSALDHEDYLREDEGIDYLSFSGEIRLNVQLLPESTALWATLGARAQLRYWGVWRAVRNSEGEVVDTKPVRHLDRDKLYQVFALVKVRI